MDDELEMLLEQMENEIEEIKQNMADGSAKSYEEYKKFCEDNHLRYAMDDCNNPISPTKRRSYKDHLYWTGGNEIGVYVERESRAKYKHLKEKLIRLG